MRIGRAIGVTDTGRRRLSNEDAFVCDPPLFAVADGMGGAQAGEVASRLAAAALEEQAAGLHGEEAVLALVQRANDRVFQRSLSDPTATGMGTTVTLALVDEEQGVVTVGHVGDSRAYRLRDGRLERLTDDHSLVAELVRSGRLTQEEADQHPHRSVITRVLGTEAVVEVDVHTFETTPGDVFLICSDGLTSMVPDDVVLELLTASAGDLDRAAETLVAAANDAGGDDNVTVLLVSVEEGDPVPRDATPMTAPAAAPPVEAVPVVAASALAGPDAAVVRSGAGSGGRLPALLLIAILLALAALLVYWSVAR